MRQVCVELDGCFAAGQAYVALSRARSPEGLQVPASTLALHVHASAAAVAGAYAAVECVCVC